MISIPHSTTRNSHVSRRYTKIAGTHSIRCDSFASFNILYKLHTVRCVCVFDALWKAHCVCDHHRIKWSKQEYVAPCDHLHIRKIRGLHHLESHQANYCKCSIKVPMLPFYFAFRLDNCVTSNTSLDRWILHWILCNIHISRSVLRYQFEIGNLCFCRFQQNLWVLGRWKIETRITCKTLIETSPRHSKAVSSSDNFRAFPSKLPPRSYITWCKLVYMQHVRVFRLSAMVCDEIASALSTAKCSAIYFSRRDPSDRRLTNKYSDRNAFP